MRRWQCQIMEAAVCSLGWPPAPLLSRPNPSASASASRPTSASGRRPPLLAPRPLVSANSTPERRLQRPAECARSSKCRRFGHSFHALLAASESGHFARSLSLSLARFNQLTRAARGAPREWKRDERASSALKGARKELLAARERRLRPSASCSPNSTRPTRPRTSGRPDAREPLGRQQPVGRRPSEQKLCLLGRPTGWLAGCK